MSTKLCNLENGTLEKTTTPKILWSFPAVMHATPGFLGSTHPRGQKSQKLLKNRFFPDMYLKNYTLEFPR